MVTRTVSAAAGNVFASAASPSVGSSPQAVAVGDFNGDGKADLVVANDTYTGAIGVLLGKGDGTFQAAQNFGVGAYATFVAVGDFNGDGKQIWRSPTATTT